MITVEQYAQRNRISENSARKRLQRKVLEGYMFKMRGPDNRFVYHDKPLVTIKWHDPFNKTLKVARSVQKDAGEGAEVVEESGHVSDPEEMASHA